MAIPPELYGYDLSQLVDCCWRRGYGNEGIPWTHKSLEQKGIAPTTLRSVLAAEFEKVGNLHVHTEPFGRDFNSPVEWKALVEVSYSRYSKKWQLRRRSPKHLDDHERKIAELNYTHDFLADGTWYYVLANHDGSAFTAARNASAIVGVFVWSQHVIKDARNYACVLEKDKVVSITPHSKWKAYECGTGNDNVFIHYVSDKIHDKGSNEPYVHGIIQATLSSEEAVIGGAPMRGNFYDLSTGRVENRGYFYSERIDTTAKPFSKEIDEFQALNLISRIGIPVIGSSKYVAEDNKNLGGVHQTE